VPAGESSADQPTSETVAAARADTVDPAGSDPPLELDAEAELRELRQVDDEPSDPVHEQVNVSDNEPFKQPVPLGLAARAPANRYANLSPWQCRKELSRRRLPVKRYRNAKGIAVPLRLTEALDGVRFNDGGQRSPFSMLDCRLALLLDDFADVLSAHGVSAVRVDNYYRRNARLPGSRKRSQHAHGLAIDITEFTLEDGRKLNVEELWGSAIGEHPCGATATLSNPSAESLLLRNLVCNVARAGLFHHILTPCHDRAHKNHLHLDIKRGTKTTMIR